MSDQPPQNDAVLQERGLINTPRHNLATNDNVNHRSSHSGGILPAYRGTGTPIQRVPTELLHEIFLLAVDAYGPSSPSPFSSDTQGQALLTGPCSRIKTRVKSSASPLLLGQVCSCWRAIVSEMAVLWANLYVGHPQMQDLPLFNLWLERSASHPIDLDFRQRNYQPEEGGDEKAAAPVRAAIFFAEALKHSSRLRYVALHLDSDMEKRFISKIAGVDQHSIQGFFLDLSGWSSKGSERIFQFLCKSPRLSRGGWGQVMSLQRIITFSQHRWSRLTTIHLVIIGIRDALYLLPLIRFVESLMVGTLLYYGDQYGTFEPAQELSRRVKLRQLTTLAFGWYGDLSPIFDSLTLPALTSITLGSRFIQDDTRSEINQRSLQELEERSGCAPRRILSDLDFSEFE
ncbi:hypothetical protein NMY22_g6350 [Coprinellus aureogranulatus]|nr:hypothetical protein NMY22_g6350 [Coprinellus aureogranulatus]